MRARCGLRIVGLAALVGAVTLARPSVAAEPVADPCGRRAVCASRSAGYVGAHSLAVGVLALAAVITNNALDPELPDVTPGDRTMEAASNGLLALELSLPFAIYSATMRTPEIGDASLSYAQSALLALSLNHGLRPLRLNSSAPVGFAVAVTSSFLLEQRAPADLSGGDLHRPSVDIRVRGTFWGLELSLASANAILAARSGRSSWPGVVLGAAAGVGVGLLTELAHRGPLEIEEPSFLDARGADSRFIWATNLSLLALGLGLPWVPCSPADDPELRYTLSPVSLGPGAAGAALSGVF